MGNEGKRGRENSETDGQIQREPKNKGLGMLTFEVFSFPPSLGDLMIWGG